jgi:acyl dehydratase
MLGFLDTLSEELRRTAPPAATFNFAPAAGTAVTVYYEDLSTGDTSSFGRYEMTREEILSFAREYDPQWFHTDPERAAAESPYGGLIASGWHTASATMRMLVDEVLSESAAVGAKGVDELRWPAPVRPGDTLTCENEVLEKVPEHPERGLVRIRTETFTEEGEKVFSMIGLVMFLRRETMHDEE